ncbi:uncharacterized protein LOC130737579 isoform X2 [Lotus japonicus]|nr:uncharacterized protein LOC130737579 isoform X2 [Lotus japonicus]
MPTSNCYAFDNSSRIFDFSSWIGYLWEYDDVKEGSDLVIRFCKDVERRSQTGYVDFGRFDRFNYFVAGSGQSDFVQEFYNGDLMGCEQTFDKMGRTEQVNIICGSCLNGQCKGRPGCICNVTYESKCRIQSYKMGAKSKIKKFFKFGKKGGASSSTQVSYRDASTQVSSEDEDVGTRDASTQVSYRDASTQVTPQDFGTRDASTQVTTRRRHRHREQRGRRSETSHAQEEPSHAQEEAHPQRMGSSYNPPTSYPQEEDP